jgi:small subunit ribosomal protein S1
MDTKIINKKQDVLLMSEFFNQTIDLPRIHDLVNGQVVGFKQQAVYINLPPYGTGIIYGREALNARDVIKNLNINDEITAKVIDNKSELGYIELSLQEARKALIWTEAEKLMKDKIILELEVKEANTGGLMLKWKDVIGFLPVSQLKTEHYPRVEGGDKKKILESLKKIIGETLSVAIIGMDKKDNKLIFSEKQTGEKEKIAVIKKYNLGDIIEGEIGGIVDFGIFIKLEENLEGLIHLSELSWSLVDNINSMFKAGDKVKAKIIDINNDRISLSIKALTKNPWEDAKTKYKIGDEIEAVVLKFNDFGALASIEEGVAGLVHMSEFENNFEKLKQNLELGKSYKFKIKLFEPKDQKMTLEVVK